MIAVSCTSSLLRASAVPSLASGVNMSAHKMQPPEEPNLEQQGWGLYTLWCEAGFQVLFTVTSALLLFAGGL